jgi:hypothetical protein
VNTLGTRTECFPKTLFALSVDDAVLVHAIELLDEMTKRRESMVRLPSCNRGWPYLFAFFSQTRSRMGRAHSVQVHKHVRLQHLSQAWPSWAGQAVPNQGRKRTLHRTDVQFTSLLRGSAFTLCVGPHSHGLHAPSPLTADARLGRGKERRGVST